MIQTLSVPEEPVFAHDSELVAINPTLAPALDDLRHALSRGSVRQDPDHEGFFEIVNDRWFYVHAPDAAGTVYLVARRSIGR